MRVWLEASLQAGSEAASLQGGSEAATLVFASSGLQGPRDTPVDLRSCQRITEGLSPDIVKPVSLASLNRPVSLASLYMFTQHT